MDDGGGVVCVGVSDRERAVAVAAAVACVYMLYAVPLGCAIHRGGREAGRQGRPLVPTWNSRARLLH